jgi:chorismate-pyruvate lyase
MAQDLDHFGDIMGLETALILPGNYTALERIILTANGNLQRILSAYFNAKVTVNVKMNEFTVEKDVLKIERMVILECDAKLLCTAKSRITVSNPKFVHLLQSGQVGIGQLFRFRSSLTRRSLDILPRFHLLKHGKGLDGLFRDYLLLFDGIECQIYELFPLDLFNY